MARRLLEFEGLVNGNQNVEGAGGVSPADATRDFRALEADYADAWFKTITGEVFG